MVTITAHQLLAIGASLMEFYEKHKLPPDALDLMRVRINDPKSNGEINFDVYLPPIFRRSAD